MRALAVTASGLFLACGGGRPLAPDAVGGHHVARNELVVQGRLEGRRAGRSDAPAPAAAPAARRPPRPTRDRQRARRGVPPGAERDRADRRHGVRAQGRADPRADEEGRPDPRDAHRGHRLPRRRRREGAITPSSRWSVPWSDGYKVDLSALKVSGKKGPGEITFIPGKKGASAHLQAERQRDGRVGPDGQGRQGQAEDRPAERRLHARGQISTSRCARPPSSAQLRARIGASRAPDQRAVTIMTTPWPTITCAAVVMGHARLMVDAARAPAATPTAAVRHVGRRGERVTEGPQAQRHRSQREDRRHGHAAGGVTPEQRIARVGRRGHERWRPRRGAGAATAERRDACRRELRAHAARFASRRASARAAAPRGMAIPSARPARGRRGQVGPSLAKDEPRRVVEERRRERDRAERPHARSRGRARPRRPRRIRRADRRARVFREGVADVGESVQIEVVVHRRTAGSRPPSLSLASCRRAPRRTLEGLAQRLVGAEGADLHRRLGGAEDLRGFAHAEPLEPDEHERVALQHRQAIERLAHDAEHLATRRGARRPGCPSRPPAAARAWRSSSGAPARAARGRETHCARWRTSRAARRRRPRSSRARDESARTSPASDRRRARSRPRAESESRARAAPRGGRARRTRDRRLSRIAP